MAEGSHSLPQNEVDDQNRVSEVVLWSQIHHDTCESVYTSTNTKFKKIYEVFTELKKWLRG